MPWPRSSVPKFGNWDKTDESSFSIVFDKARAEKERFLHSPDSNVSAHQSFYKNINLDTGKKILDPNKARADRQRFLPTSEQVKMFTRTQQNALKDPEVIAGSGASHAPAYNTFPPGAPSRPPWQVRATKGSTFHNEKQYVDQADRGFHERLHAKSVNAPGRWMYTENPPISKIRSSQGVLEAANLANAQKTHAVPKFGDWDSGDAFTAAFNKARNEKSSKNALHSVVNAGSPLQPDEDLYKSAEFSGGSAERKKRMGGFQWLCCSGAAPI